MRPLSFTLAAILSRLLQACSFPLRSEVPAVGATPVTDDKSLLAALAVADAAQRELQSGNAAPDKAIWSQTEHATLIGGFGGGVTRSNGKLGYVVQIERIRFQVPGQTKESSRGFACHPIPR